MGWHDLWIYQQTRQLISQSYRLEGLCNSKMIMSYMSKVEMFYFGGAKLSRLRRRQDGEKGHYHDEAEGVETAAWDSQREVDPNGWTVLGLS
jgi:hypothetical protein